MKTIVVVLLSLLFVSCGKPTLTTEQIFKIGANSAVRVLTISGNPHGSGFITEGPKGNRVIITNEHVCYGAGFYRLKFQGLGEIEVVSSPMLSDKEHDLCVFEIPKELQAVVTPMPIAPNLFLHGPVFAIGYPLQYPLSISNGFTLERSIVSVMSLGRSDCPNKIPFLFGIFICSQEEQLIITSAPIFPGNSGSMAVNQEGEVIGVFNSGSRDTNYGNLVPLEDLKEFLSKL